MPVYDPNMPDHTEEANEQGQPRRRIIKKQVVKKQVS